MALLSEKYVVEVELAQIVGLAAFDEGPVPGEGGQGQVRLARRGPSAGFASMIDAFDDVHLRAEYTLRSVVPPAFVIDQRDAAPAVEGLVQPLVAPAFVRPVEQLDELISGKVHLHVAEIVPELGEVDQGDDDVGIGGGRQAVGIAAGDGQPPVSVLEIEGLLAPWGAIRQQGDRELGEVHLVPADQGSRCDRLVARWSGVVVRPCVYHSMKKYKKATTSCRWWPARCGAVAGEVVVGL